MMNSLKIKTFCHNIILIVIINSKLNKCIKIGVFLNNHIDSKQNIM